MEIADVYVINKSDRPGADLFARNIKTLVSDKHSSAPVIKVSAINDEGIDEVVNALDKMVLGSHDLRSHLFTEKAYKLIEQKRMKDIDKRDLKIEIEKQVGKSDFNLYRFIAGYITPGNKPS
jgi:LAO/AO transport system kinase